MVIFDEVMAKEIVDFVEEYRYVVGTIIRQCEAGISRSAGIAAALSKCINGDDKYFFNRYLPNSLVYSKIIKAWGE